MVSYIPIQAVEVTMRRYGQGSSNVTEAMCNMCGRSIKIQKGMITDGVLSIEYKWGYFSDFDGETHSFDICQDCYKKLEKKFVIPIDKEDTTELM